MSVPCAPAHPVGTAAAHPVPSRSVAQKVNAEIVLLLGWAPAILMQFAHPLVAAGVTAHSTFLTRPDQRPRRLRQTLASMLALTFGTAAEAGRAARTINGIHDRVTG